jgi:hypothetical protein
MGRIRKKSGFASFFLILPILKSCYFPSFFLKLTALDVHPPSLMFGKEKNLDTTIAMVKDLMSQMLDKLYDCSNFFGEKKHSKFLCLGS